MAGILGSRSKAAYDVTGREKPGLGKQILNQIGMNLLGVDFEGQRVSNALAQVQRQAAMQAAGLLSPQTIARQAQIGNADGEDITAAFAPEYDLSQRQRTMGEIMSGLADITARTPGFDPTKWREMALAAKPDLQAVNNVLVDRNNPNNAGMEIPEVDKGQRHVYDAQGRPIGIMDENGYVQSLTKRAEAQALGAAMGSIRPAPTGNGGTLDMTGREYLSGDRRVGGLGYTPSPVEASGAKIVGDAVATAQTTLPSDLNAVDTAIDTARSLRNHPALGMRTGGWSVLPAIPGTPGASFEAYKEQVLGQGFMSARQALKGAGQITDFEGKKAEQAQIRMKAAQTPQDFQKALDDYIGALERGRAIMQQRAGVPGQGVMSTPQTTGRNGSRIISVGQ